MGNNNSLYKNSNIESKDESIKNSYFKTIKQLRREFYLQNENNLNNISISFKNESFDSTISNEFSKESNNQNDNYIHWIDYFYNYLFFLDEQKIEWATNLIQLLDNEYFLLENKYLSLFFFEEFSIKTKPNCIKDIYKSQTRDTKLSFSELSITKNLGGSFVSIDTENLSLNDPAIDYKNKRTKVKQYIKIFKEHISKEDHPIHIIVKKFCKVFSNYINDKIKKVRNDVDYLNNMISNITDDITNQLQTFIIKLQVTLKLMYCKTLDFSFFKNEKDELINIITSLVFRLGNLYQVIYELYSLNLNQSLKNLEEKLNYLNDIKPEDLGIDKALCLNNITLNYQLQLIDKLRNDNLNQNKKESDKNVNNVSINKEKLIKIKEVIIKKTKNTPLIINKLQKNYKENKDESRYGLVKENTLEDDIPNNLIPILPEDNNKLNEYKKDNIKNINQGNHNFIHPQKKLFLELNDKKPKDVIYSPYTSCILLIKSLKKYKSPFEKNMIIASLSDEILDSVNEFWKDLYEFIEDKSIFTIDANQLRKIILYIIIKSNMPDIMVNCKMINLFTTYTIKNSTIGNYLSYVEASITYLMEINNINDILENKNNLNSENEINTNSNIN